MGPEAALATIIGARYLLPDKLRVKSATLL